MNVVASPKRTRRPERERLPLVAWLLALIGASFFALAFIGLIVRAPWSDLWEIIRQRTVTDALRLSLVTSLWATVLSVTFGVPLAWVLARGTVPGRRLLRALCALSMVLPPVVGGVALFFALGRRGLVGQHLDAWFGLRLPYSTAGVVIAQMFVSMPFLVITVEAAIRQLDRRYEDAARTLGASRWSVFRLVTLPSVRPAVLAGAVLCWARALGEFGATITFAGNLPGLTQTMPLKVYSTLETDHREAIVLSLLLVVVSFAVLVGLRDRWMGSSFVMR